MSTDTALRPGVPDAYTSGVPNQYTSGLGVRVKITVKDNGVGAHRVTLGEWEFSVVTDSGLLFRANAGPGVPRHGVAEPPYALTAALGALNAGDWLNRAPYGFRVDLALLQKLADEQAAEAAAVEAAKPAWWLTPMKASSRGMIVAGDVVALYGALKAARKARGDYDGADRAAYAAYGVRVADAVRCRERETLETRRERIERLTPPAPLKRPRAGARRGGAQ